MTHSSAFRRYLIVFGALLALTGLTTAIAYVHLGPFNTIAAVAIAATKALIVVVFFMHLTDTPPRTRLAAAAGVMWLMILIAFTVTDLLTRGWTN